MRASRDLSSGAGSRWINSASASWIAFAVLFGFALVTGFIGLDFGFHWDEPIHYKLVMGSLHAGSFLPVGEYNYNYPSMTFTLSIVAQLPSGLLHLLANQTPRAFAEWLTLERFLSNARGMFLVVSGLGGLWLYLALRQTHRTGALVASAVYLSSWEFAYHARWVAPDAVMAQFTALWLLMLFLADRSPTHGTRWLRGAAAVAGLATATKYPGGATLLATLVFMWLRMRDTPITGQAKLREALLLIAIFGGTFLLITPGALLQPGEFLQDIKYETDHYASGHDPHFGVHPYDIHEGAHIYAMRLFEYVATALFSRSPLISCLVFSLALLGFAMSLQESKRLTGVLGGLVVFYAAFFSSQVVFIARNFLLLLPIFALMAGLGAQFLISRRQVWLRMLVGAGLAITFGWNAVELWKTAASIPAFATSPALLKRTQEYIAKRPNEIILLAPRLETALADAGNAIAKNPARVKSGAAVLLFRWSDLRNYPVKLTEWPATHARTFEWLGPDEVNFNYYPTWNGRDRVLVMPVEKARELGLLDFFAVSAPAR